MRIWDVRPYAPVDRQLKLFLGAQHGFEKVSLCAHVCVACLSHCFDAMKNLLRCAWTPDSTRIAAGSADR